MERDWYSVNVFKTYRRNTRVVSTWANKYASNNGWPLLLSHSKIKYYAKLAGRRKIHILCGVWCSNRLRPAHRSSVDDGVYMLYYPCGRNLDRSQVCFIWASVLPYVLGLLQVVDGCVYTCWGILRSMFSGTALLIFRVGIIFHACPKSDISGRNVFYIPYTDIQ